MNQTNQQQALLQRAAEAIARRDPQGALTIQKLIGAASHGGGYVRYAWQRPSTGRVAPKLGYVVALERWGWMVGTGIYLDDVDTALQRIDARASANIERTMSWLTAIALTGAAAIAVCALVLNVSESRSADAKWRKFQGWLWQRLSRACSAPRSASRAGSSRASSSSTGTSRIRRSGRSWRRTSSSKGTISRSSWTRWSG